MPDDESMTKRQARSVAPVGSFDIGASLFVILRPDPADMMCDLYILTLIRIE